MEKLKQVGRDAWLILKRAAKQWYADNTFQQGAALAYYSVFSIAPILVIALAIAGAIFGKEAAQQHLASQLQDALGPKVAGSVQEILRSAHTTGSGWLATGLSIAALLVGAISLFTQLQTSLDSIWGVKPREGGGIWGAIKDRLISFLLVVAVGLLLLLSLIGSTILNTVGEFIHLSSWPGARYLWGTLHWVVFIALLTGMFGLIYKVLPDVELSWGDVWVGGLVTAVLVVIGSYLIGLYLARSSVSSAYGAAGSLVIILLWVYYSSQVLLFGAECTQAYAHYIGKPLRPTEKAEPLQQDDRDRLGLGSPGPAAATDKAHA